MTEEQINEELRKSLKLALKLEKQGNKKLAKRVLAFASKFAEIQIALLEKEQEAFNKETTLDHVRI